MAKSERVDRDAVVRPRLDVKQLLERYELQIKQVAPRVVTPERMMRLLYTAVARVPELAECSAASLIGSFLEVASLGLEVGIAGQAWILPFYNSRKSCKEATLIVGYRGFCTLMWRSELIASVEAEVVREGDLFEWQKGTDGFLRHRRGEGTQYGEVTDVYAIIRTTKSVVPIWDVMTRDDVDRIRNRSRAKDSGPWVTDYEEMAKKTLLRRLAKLAPISIEGHRAIDLDEAGERGEQTAMFDLPELPEAAGGGPEAPKPPVAAAAPAQVPAEPQRQWTQAEKALGRQPVGRAGQEAAEAAQEPQERVGAWRPGGGAEEPTQAGAEGAKEGAGEPEPRSAQEPQGERTCDLPGCREPAAGIYEAGAACAAHERFFKVEE